MCPRCALSVDFDNIPLPVADTNGLLMDDNDQWIVDGLFFALQRMRVEAERNRLDMTDTFESYSGSLKEKNTGIMAKNRFRATMGMLFKGGSLDKASLDTICTRYGTGDPDPREPGTFMQVRWKQFAKDFDEVPPMPPPPLPDPTPEIVEYMRDMNRYCNLHGFDLAWEFEEYMGGKDKCTSDLMPRDKFRRGLAVILGKATSLYQLDTDMLDQICHVYRAGAPNARNPSEFELVQWKEFSLDVNRIQPMPYLEGLQGMVHTYPQVGALGEEDFGLDSRIAPVCGSSTCSSSPTTSSMDLGYGKGQVSFGGFKTTQKPQAVRQQSATAKASSPTKGTGSQHGTQRTQRSTARSTTRGGGGA